MTLLPGAPEQGEDRSPPGGLAVPLQGPGGRRSAEDELIARWAACRPAALCKWDRTAEGADPKAHLERGRLLHRELRVRFARMAHFLRGLPLELPEHPGIRRLARRHAAHVSDLEACKEPQTASTSADFTTLLHRIIAQQGSFEEDLLSGFMDLARRLGSSCAEVEREIDAIVHRLVVANVGTKLLMSHYVASQDSKLNHMVRVKQERDPANSVRSAAKRCKGLCKAALATQADESATPEVYSLVPGYLQYTLNEVLTDAYHSLADHYTNGALPADTSHVEDRHGRVTSPVLHRCVGTSRETREQVAQFLQM